MTQVCCTAVLCSYPWARLRPSRTGTSATMSSVIQGNCCRFVSRVGLCDYDSLLQRNRTVRTPSGPHHLHLFAPFSSPCASVPSASLLRQSVSTITCIEVQGNSISHLLQVEPPPSGALQATWRVPALVCLLSIGTYYQTRRRQPK